MRYFVENTLENLTLIRTISDGFPDTETERLYSQFKHHDTILLGTEGHLTPKFRFIGMPQVPYLSEAELREVVFTLSLEQ